MDQSEFQRIERELGISLPPEYARVMSDLFGSERAQAFEGPYSNLFMTADQVVRFNQMEREENAATPYAFPNWWETFVLIGTNGGGDYYSLRLGPSDDVVWMIGSDCGDKPSRINASLEEFIQENYNEFLDEQRKQRDIAERRKAYEPEFEAHRSHVERTEKGSPDGIAWMECNSGYRIMRMLDRLSRRPTARKMRLFGIANCRLTEALEDDADCREGLMLATRMTDEVVEDARIAEMESRLRTRVKRLEEGGGPANSTTRRRLLWQTKAVHHLFQMDDAYEVEAGIHPGDPKLTEVMNACSYAMQGEPYGNDVQLNLLHEVLGNPFVEVVIDSDWKTDEVCDLARQMHDNDRFDRMPELAALLKTSGCDDPRVIEHCRRPHGHVRGCWVVDQLLDLAGDSKEDVVWSFSCVHPTVDVIQLKAQLERFGTDGDRSRDDEDAREAFAGWLDDNGDPTWAEYIHIRSRLDGTPGDDYVDLFERSFELEAGMQPNMLALDNIYFSGYQFASEAWWEEEIDDYSYGLPYQVVAVNPGSDPRPLDVFIPTLDALVEKTPIRALDLDDFYRSEIGPLLDSEGGKKIQWLAFESQTSRDDEKASTQILDLVGSDTAKRLRRLTVENLVRSDLDANALAGAEFDELRRVTVPYGKVNCSPPALKKWMSCGWFKKLEHWGASFDDQCGDEVVVHLSKLPKLHSLNLVQPGAGQLLGFQQSDRFEKLRRLRISGADLAGDSGRSLGSARFPRLIELCLQHCEFGPKDLLKLLKAPSFENLQALTLAGPMLDDETFQLLGELPFASTLRVLRLRCGDENLVGPLSSLANSALTRDDGFPRLSTLELKNPFLNAVPQDVPKFFGELALPNLRQFALIDCEIGDDAVSEMVGNPSFSGLTMLNLESGYDASAKMSANAVDWLFRCPHFDHLLELAFKNFAIGDQVALLTDKSVLPSLRSASIWGSGASQAVKEEVANARPGVYIGS